MTCTQQASEATPISIIFFLQFWPSKLGHKGGSYSKVSAKITTYELGMMMSNLFFSDTKKIRDIPPRKTTLPPIEVGKWRLKSSSRPPFSPHGRKRNNLIVSFVPGFVKFSSPRRSVWMMLAAITHIFKILIFGARPREIQPCQLMLKSKTSQKLCFVVFHQPIWNIWVKMGIFPQLGMKNKKYVKPPTRN